MYIFCSTVAVSFQWKSGHFYEMYLASIKTVMPLICTIRKKSEMFLNWKSVFGLLKHVGMV